VTGQIEATSAGKSSNLRRQHDINLDLRISARKLVCLRKWRWVYNTTSKMLGRLYTIL